MEANVSRARPVFAGAATGSYRSFAEVMNKRDDDESTFVVGRTIDGGRTEWSVRAWREAIFRGAAQLAAAGVGPGTRIAVPAINTPDALLAIFACWTANACCVPIEVGGRGRANWILDAMSADCEFIATVRGAHGAVGLSELDATEPTLVVLDPSIDTKATCRPTDLSAAALCLYSSGTTGSPKGINLSYSNLLINLESMKTAFRWNSNDRVITVLPISHGNGLLIGSLLPWLCGSSMILCDRFSVSSFWAIVTDEGATRASVVPTVLAYLDASDEATWPSSFRGFVSGSGPLPRAVARRVVERGFEVRQIYGLSETTCVATMTPPVTSELLDMDLVPPLEHLVSVGPVVPHVEVAVLDESGTTQPAGTGGELAVRGSLIMQGYHGQSGPVTDSNGWFRTGDQGCWRPGPDGAPWFYVTGRLKDLIIRGGLNISPLEIEDALLQHPALDEAMAFGIPDETLGEAIGVAVVAKSGLSEHDVLTYADAVLDRAKRPVQVFMVEAIPKTRSGKIRRKEFARRLLLFDDD